MLYGLEYAVYEKAPDSAVWELIALVARPSERNAVMDAVSECCSSLGVSVKVGRVLPQEFHDVQLDLLKSDVFGSWIHR